MRHWFLLLPREARVLASLAAFCGALIILFWLSTVAELMFGGLRKISRIEPQVGRLLGYEQVENELDIALEQAKMQLREVSYAAGDGSQAGARLQQSLRGFAEDAGLTVTGSQLIAEEEKADAEVALFEVLAVDLSLQGPPLALDRFLAEIRLHTPRLAISKMDIVKPRRARQTRGQPLQDPEVLDVRMTVFGLRELP